MNEKAAASEKSATGDVPIMVCSAKKDVPAMALLLHPGVRSGQCRCCHTPLWIIPDEKGDQIEMFTLCMKCGNALAELAVNDYGFDLYLEPVEEMVRVEGAARAYQGN
jgi:hypothetical protein